VGGPGDGPRGRRGRGRGLRAAPRLQAQRPRLRRGLRRVATMSEAVTEPVPALRARLSLMMFLQYAIWGAWLPILYPFLLGHRHFSLDQVGWILAAGAVGAILGPFIAGQVADRHVATERCLCVSHLLGAVLVWFLADVADFQTFLVLSLLYGLI